MYIKIIIFLNKLFGLIVLPPQNRILHLCYNLGLVVKIPSILISEEDIKQQLPSNKFKDLIIDFNKHDQYLLRKISIKELGDFINKDFSGVSIFSNEVEEVSRSYLLGNNKDNFFCTLSNIQDNWINNPYCNNELLDLDVFSIYLKIHLNGGGINRSVDLLYCIENKYKSYVRITDEKGNWCSWFPYNHDLKLPIDVFQLDRILDKI